MFQKCFFGFVPNPNCDNCQGTGIFAEDENGNPIEPCHFCQEEWHQQNPSEPVLDELKG